MLRKRREPWRYVSSGVGTLGHLLGEYWAQKEGLRLAYSRHDGPGRSTDDLIAGRIPIGSINATTALLRRRELIPLAVSSARRLPGLDEVPTFQELGYPDFVATNWYGLSAPRRLPPSITTRMSEAIAAVIDDPTVIQADSKSTRLRLRISLRRCCEANALWSLDLHRCFFPAAQLT
jgi:tripartite-type tricarboxylate transporter receptor subunit TctC